MMATTRCSFLSVLLSQRGVIRAVLLGTFLLIMSET